MNCTWLPTDLELPSPCPMQPLPVAASMVLRLQALGWPTGVCWGKRLLTDRHRFLASNSTTPHTFDSTSNSNTFSERKPL
jgi:hypothetical protein